MGTAAHMGPGYLPFWLGIGLGLLGVIIAILSASPRRETDLIARPDWRVLLLITASVAMFSIGLRTLGLFLSLALLIGISSLACHRFHWKAVAGNALFLVLFSWLVFVKGLKLVLPLWPTWPVT